MNLQEGRDVVVIVAGSLTILVLLAIFIFTVVLGLATRTLLGVVQRLLKEEVAPLLQSVRQTVQRVHGTITFVSEAAVSPVIRVYGVFAGARRMMGVLSGIRSRRGHRQQE